MHLVDKLGAAKSAHKRLSEKIAELEELLKAKEEIIDFKDQLIQHNWELITDLESTIKELRKQIATPKPTQRRTRKKKEDVLSD